MQFKATKDFFSKETQSQYCQGMFYTCRDKKLVDLAKQWVIEGKVIMSESQSIVSGVGEQKDRKENLFRRFLRLVGN